MADKITALIIVAILIAVPLFSLFANENYKQLDIDIFGGGQNLPEQMEEYLSENMPGKLALGRLKHRLLVWGGLEEFDGFFFKEGKLIKNYAPDDENGITGNLQNIFDFILQKQMPSYIMLIPTACVVCQEDVPELADIFNQKTMIDTVYSAFSGNAITVDAYGALFRNREKYIYYNTDPLVTSLGGYYLYNELAGKLGKTPSGMSGFDVTYAGYGFYGSLYKEMPMDGVKSDVISLYSYKSYDRNYTVTHYKEGYTYSYDSLYVPEFESTENKTDIILGGLSPIVTIETSRPYKDELLIFGDETAKSYVPFLANHYAKITVVSLDKLTPELAQTIEIDQYRQVLFAYSAETFAELGALDNIGYFLSE